MKQIRMYTDSKGPQMEEVLRGYFLKSGYFVIRGVPFIYGGFDITDIDLWLYNRVSSVSREISIVDVKNKKTPQAIERIFWTKGLQSALGVSKAIVATTDSREEVRKFGRELDVLVLDGRFVKRLSTSSRSAETRIREEEFQTLLVDESLGKLEGDWAKRVRRAKAKLASGLSFDSFNYWMGEGHFFAEQILSRPAKREQGLRCAYLMLSFATLAVDYILRDLSFLEEGDRERVLRDGFAYGERGRSGTKSMIDFAGDLISQFTDRGAALASQIHSRFETAMGQLPANILSQFFSRGDIGRVLFDAAKELEALAMTRDLLRHSTPTTGARAVIGCALDFWGLDRRQFFSEQQQMNLSVESSVSEGGADDSKQAKEDSTKQ